MKKIFLLGLLSATTVLSAQSYQGQPSYQNAGYSQQGSQGYYQGQGQPAGYQNSGYSQGQSSYQNPNYSQNNQGYQGQQGNQGYYQGQAYPNGAQGQGYYQGQSYQNSQPYQQNQNSQWGNDKQDNNPKNVSDDAIAKDVHNALADGMFSKGYPEVTFEVSNGQVTLAGTVEKMDDKRKVEEAVRKINGVQGVVNKVTVAGDRSQTADNGNKINKNEKDYPQDFAATDSDRLLNAKIRDKISNGWFTTDYKAIVVQTRNGVVIISGTVDKFDDIKKIGDEVKKIDGVKSVNNQLQARK